MYGEIDCLQSLTYAEDKQEVNYIIHVFHCQIK